ncbi:MAG: nitroreductase [Proteobacteria bacterium]|nr:nitroreductase [Pseudomonadota bacterium]
MELFEAIDTRSSAARLVAPVPDAAQLDRILRAAGHAPDHGHMAPWRFIILDGPSRDRFADTIAASRRRRDPRAPAEAVEADRQKVLRAPMIIVVGCATQLDHPKIPEIEQVLAAGAATQNLLLAAHALGFGAVWKTGPAAYDPFVKSALGFAPTDHIIAMVHIGTAQVMNPVRPPQLGERVRRG